MKQMMYTVSFRRITTGYKETAFSTDSLDSARVMAQILVQNPQFAHCYAVATDSMGNVVFNLTTAPPAPQPQPQPYYQPAPYAPARLPAYQPQPQAYPYPSPPGYAPYQHHQQHARPHGYTQPPQMMRPAPQAYSQPAPVIEAEFDEVEPRYALTVGTR